MCCFLIKPLVQISYCVEYVGYLYSGFDIVALPCISTCFFYRMMKTEKMLETSSVLSECSDKESSCFTFLSFVAFIFSKTGGIQPNLIQNTWYKFVFKEQKYSTTFISFLFPGSLAKYRYIHKFIDIHFLVHHIMNLTGGIHHHLRNTTSINSGSNGFGSIHCKLDAFPYQVSGVFGCDRPASGWIGCFRLCSAMFDIVRLGLNLIKVWKLILKFISF